MENLPLPHNTVMALNNVMVVCQSYIQVWAERRGQVPWHTQLQGSKFNI